MSGVLVGGADGPGVVGAVSLRGTGARRVIHARGGPGFTPARRRMSGVLVDGASGPGDRDAAAGRRGVSRHTTGARRVSHARGRDGLTHPGAAA